MRKAIATYMGQVRYVDDSVGRLMEALKETGRDADTLVLFFSDHGELLGNHGMTHKIPVFYDALTRIPAILRHPTEHWEKKVFRGLVEEVDLAPTLLELLEVPVPATMTGKSLAGALRAGDDTGKDSALCEAGIAAPMLHEPVPGLTLRAPFEPTSYGCGAMIRRGDWKLSVYAEDLGELYHVTEDPEERENLFENPEYADIRNDLTLRLLKRVLGVKIRDVAGDVWNTEEYPVDVRRMPLEV